MVKVGLIQTKSYRTNKEGISKISKILEQLGKMKVELVCLPEQWLKDNQIDDFNTEFVDFKENAKKYQMTIIPGAFYTKTDKEITISSPVIDPNGEIIGTQEKIHPYDYERKIIKSGKEAKIFNTSCKFGILICYDMVFPHVANILVKKGAQILLSPSRIVKRGISPWETYVRARSLENRVPIIAANVKNKRFGGNSLIIDLWESNKVMVPKVLKIEDEGFIVKNMDLKKFERARRTRFSDSKEFF